MEDVITFLNRYKELELEYLRYSHGVRELEDQCARRAAIARRVFGEETNTLRLYREELEQQRKKLQKALTAQQEIEDFIDGVEGEKNRIVLRLRFLEHLGWKEVTHQLERSLIHYSEDHVRHYLKREAMEAARKSWTGKTEKEPENMT